MIDWKNIFNQPVENNKITYENIRKVATGLGIQLVVCQVILISNKIIK